MKYCLIIDTRATIVYQSSSAGVEGSLTSDGKYAFISKYSGLGSAYIYERTGPDVSGIVLYMVKTVYILLFDLNIAIYSIINVYNSHNQCDIYI